MTICEHSTAIVLALTVMSIEYLGIKLSFLRGHTNTCDLRRYTLMTIFIPYSELVWYVLHHRHLDNDNDNNNYNDIRHLWLLFHKYASFQLDFSWSTPPDSKATNSIHFKVASFKLIQNEAPDSDFVWKMII